jgi:hypothetical protein
MGIQIRTVFCVRSLHIDLQAHYFQIAFIIIKFPHLLSLGMERIFFFFHINRLMVFVSFSIDSFVIL